MSSVIHRKLLLKAFWCLTIATIVVALIYPVPSPLFDAPYATVIESKDGQLLGAKLASDEQWRFPALDSLPANYRECLLEYEDKYFYLHPGVNPVSILRALKQNLSVGKIVSGGSTITMQVARMALGNRPRTSFQKMKEIFLALRIEVRYTKDEILLLYANNAPFGGNVVGISAASWRYYGRSPFNLSWAEASNLVILPNNPGQVFPGKHNELIRYKRNVILTALGKRGILDQLNLRLSMEENVPSRPNPLPRLAPHLLDQCIRNGLSQRTTVTTLNYQLQNTVNQIINQYHQHTRFKHINNIAVLVADIKTGEVQAYIGNVPAVDKEDHGNDIDMIASRRSPGSLLKPILYALAIDGGLMMPGELLPDVPVYYQGFSPRNFDKQFRGAVPANLALRSSLNVPFVSLLREYGYERFHHDLRQLGIKSLDQPPGHYGLSIILGGGEVTLWEMTGLYASLARNLQGYNHEKGSRRYRASDFRQLTWIAGKQPASSPLQESSSISAAATWHTLSAMQELRRPDEESNWQQFSNSRQIAWKTGTSYGHRDAWAIGLNDNYIVGVWAGNADGEGRPDLTGVTMAAPLLFRIFDVLPGSANFPMPVADMEIMRVCRKSGRKAGEFCPETDARPISKHASVTQVCQLHREIFLDATEKFCVHASCYPMNRIVKKPWFILPPSQAWYYRQYNSDYADLPVFLAGCETGTSKTMEMIYPSNFTRVFVPFEIDGRPGRVVFEAAHRNPSSRIYWYLDDLFLGYTSDKHQMGLYPDAGLHKLSLVDDMGVQLSVNFEAINERRMHSDRL